MIDLSNFCSKMGYTFTDSDRNSCLPLVEKIDSYAIEASQKGLLAMEEMSQIEDNKFLRVALELVMSAAKADTIADILMATIIADKPTGAELLNKLIVIQAAMCFTDTDEYTYTIEPYKPPLIKKMLYAMCMGVGKE
jgi:hypothetical protein